MTETVWYYQIQGEAFGPIAEPDLCNLFRKGQLLLDVPVRSEFTNAWLPAGNIICFKLASRAAGLEYARTEPTDGPPPGAKLAKADDVNAGNPPAAPPATAPANKKVAAPPALPIKGDITPRPIVRYFARKIDMFLALLVLVMLMLNFGQPSPLVFAAVMLCGAIGWPFVEAFCFAVFGTTPGKLMLNIRVTTDKGHRLSFGQALRRSYEVCFIGLALSITGVSIVSQVLAAIHLVREGKTAWDRHGKFVVRHGSCGFGRVFATLVLLASTTLLVVSTDSAKFGQWNTRTLAYLNKFMSPFTGPQSALADQTPQPVATPAPAPAPPLPPPIWKPLVGEWEAMTAPTGPQHLIYRDTLILHDDATFTEVLESLPPEGSTGSLRLLGQFAGTWSVTGRIFIKSMTDSTFPTYPAGTWQYDIFFAKDGAMKLRRFATPLNCPYVGQRAIYNYKADSH
jgi:uncharacterized RDD family membrane protein YckC